MHDEGELYADEAVSRVAQTGGAVPGNFQSEVANALLASERRGRIDAEHVRIALTEILALPLTVEAINPHLAMELAREHSLTCYDSFYLAVALKLDAPLATLDARLAAAARSVHHYWQASA